MTGFDLLNKLTHYGKLEQNVSTMWCSFEGISNVITGTVHGVVNSSPPMIAV